MDQKLSGRLTPVDRSDEFYPWRRAYTCTRCFLYWLPLSAFPAPADQRQWLNLFFDRFADVIVKDFGLREEMFLQFKALDPHLKDAFLKTAEEFQPIMGLSRRPAAEPLPVFTLETGQAIGRGEMKLDIKQYMAEYCYWFFKKNPRRQREVFFGYGGTTTLFLKPDPSIVAPKLVVPPMVERLPIWKEANLEERLARTLALKDAFLSKSKQLFGADLQQEPHYRGLLYILPLLGTKDFFAQEEKEVEKWFDLFDVYINESPSDKGVVMAFKKDMEGILIDLLLRLREEKQIYPGDNRHA